MHIERCVYVPKLAHNLLSVSKVTEAGKTMRSDAANCQLLDGNRKLIAVGVKVGDLYYLNCHNGLQQTSMAQSKSQKTKEDVWHQRFGHLGARNLEKLAKDKLVDGFDYDASKEINFCESCAEEKHHRNSFPTDGGRRSDEPLGLVHMMSVENWIPPR